MSGRAVALIAVIGLAVSIHAEDQGATAAGQTPAAPAGTALIIGRVIDGTTGAAVTGVAVTIGGANSPRTGNIVLVDSQGRFIFGRLAAGTYTLLAQKNGYIPGSFGRTRHDGERQSIELRDDERRTDATIRIWRYGSISGRVVDEAGEPVSGAYVQSYRRTWVAGRASLSTPGGGAETDDRGMFRLGRLVPGEYVVGMPSRLVTYPVGFVEADAAARQAGGALQQARSAELSARGSAMLATFPAYPSPRIGNFTLARADGPDTPVPTGNERLSIYPITFHPNARTTEQATPIILAAGEERSGVDLHVSLTPTVAISGIASGPDGPIENLGLRLQLPPEFQFRSRMLVEPAHTVSGPTGAFTFLGVPTGSFVIVASAGTVSAAMPVTVGDRDLVNVKLTLHPNAKVSGRIEFDGTPPKSPFPPPGLVLGLDRVDGDMERRVFQAQPDGAILAAAPPGRYFVRLESVTAVPTSSAWTLKSAMLNGRDVSDVPMTIGGDDLTGLVVTFTDRAGGLTGTVRTAQNAVDATASVLVFPTDRALWVDYGARPRRLRIVRTDRAGAFAVTGLPAGEYFAIAVPDEVADNWQRPAVLARAATLATRVKIADDGNVTLNLVVARWQP